MANKLLAVGCSFLMPRKGVIPQVQILADTLDYKLVNRSIAGNGNQHIVYHVIDEVQKHDYELVCIGWSNPGRWDYITKNNKWFAHKVINFLDDINKDIDLDQTFEMQWCPQVLMSFECVQDFLFFVCLFLFAVLRDGGYSHFGCTGKTAERPFWPYS